LDCPSPSVVGIRGNFGHAYGALVPDALAARAVVLVSGRENWRWRIAYLAFCRGRLVWLMEGELKRLSASTGLKLAPWQNRHREWQYE